MRNLGLVFAFAVYIASAALPLHAEELRFNRDIRPLLSANCFQCHGPDSGHREADLRLDTEEGVRQVFKPGNLKESEAWQRITTDDTDFRMPPLDSHRELNANEIALIKQWIEEGAKWEGHWSFIPPKKPQPPMPKRPDWVANPIDAFILARLEKEGLKPGDPAERERLLRRVTFDLTGLPPTLEEIDNFVNDKSPDAYEKVVDRLLASEHFGERMALMWMDAARYGDSSVFHADGPRDMWGWRDWVIRAYNDNKRFDQFTIEQLAGDLLPNSTVENKIATGFLRNNATTDEGGAIAEEFRVEYAVDRVKTTSMVWLGLSMECGQCHDHKYDPISQREYYQFFAYFNQASDPGMQSRRGNQTPVVDVPNLLAQAKVTALKEELKTVEAELAKREQQPGEQFAAWVKEAAANVGDQPLLPEDQLLYATLDEGSGNKIAFSYSEKPREGKLHGNSLWAEGQAGKALKLDGGNFVDLGDVANFERDMEFSYGAWIKPQGGGGAPIARMDDRGGYRGYDLYIQSGRVAVHIINTWPSNAVKVTTKNALKPDAWQHVFMTYDGSSKAAGIKIYFDGVEQEWAIEQDGLSATIRTGKTLYLGRRNPGSPFKGEVDEVRIYDRKLSQEEVAALAGSDPIGPLLAKPADQRTAEETQVLVRHYLNNHNDEYKALRKNASRLQGEIAAADKPQGNVMVMADVPKMRPTYMLDRGNYDSPQKDKEVKPGVPAVFPPLAADAPANRLGMAQWLVNGSHPLTARVTVNRYWHMIFGTGLVKTVEDFGAQGEWPSHPDLLDWLAVDFVENGWDIKRTLKLMVMSNTYRQSSRVSRALVDRDPHNRLLARGPRFRLQGEFIRDNALAASGLLVDKIGGRGVKPYQPAGLWNEVSLSGNVRFKQDTGKGLYRRSMYIYWKRSAPAPSMTIFDAPTREICILRRGRTNTPLQALVTLNDPQFVEAARALAERTMKEGGDTLDAQITYAYRLTAGVQPKPATLQILKEAYEEELAIFQAEATRAEGLLKVGDSARDAKLNAAQHAAMTIVCSMILNLDETVTKG